MSELIPDPLDSSRYIVAEAATSGLGMQVGPTTINNVHPPSTCAGQPCVVHNPSQHHMRSWRLNWRDDSGLFERLCPHGIGHPDPDSLNWHLSQGRDWIGVHGCDGCCRAGREE